MFPASSGTVSTSCGTAQQAGTQAKTAVHFGSDRQTQGPAPTQAAFAVCTHAPPKQKQLPDRATNLKAEVIVGAALQQQRRGVQQRPAVEQQPICLLHNKDIVLSVLPVQVGVQRGQQRGQVGRPIAVGYQHRQPVPPLLLLLLLGATAASSFSTSSSSAARIRCCPAVAAISSAADAHQAASTALAAAASPAVAAAAISPSSKRQP